MGTIESVKKDLETNYHDNITYLLNDDEYLVISELLKCDYGFFDIVLDINKILDELNEAGVSERKDILSNHILLYMLCNLGIKPPCDLDISLYDWIIKNLVLFEDILNKRTEEYLDNKIRVHLLLDDMDEDLKYEISKILSSKELTEEYDTIGIVPRVYKKNKKRGNL